MNIRHALFAILAASALLALLMLPQTEAVHADEQPVRPTPTPARPPSDREVTPQDFESVEGSAPDLVVESIEFSPNPIIISNTVRIEVTITNIGNAPVADDNNFFVDLFLNPEKAPRPCSTGNYHWSVQGFEVGSGSHTLSMTLDPANDPKAAALTDVGTAMIYAVVDSGPGAEDNTCGWVNESREDNNVRVVAADVTTSDNWSQMSHEDFRAGFSSALDLTHPQGVLQNGTGWFIEPRFPPPEDPEWPSSDWNSPNFYNPDRHVQVYNLPDDFPRDKLDTWNPPAQNNASIEVGFEDNVLYAVWDDEKQGSNNRDIFFSYSVDGGKTWVAPTQVNEADTGTEGSDQIKPELVLDRQAKRLYIFWQDNRLDGSYDIFFARSTDFGVTWEEPMRDGLPVNPINDKGINPGSDQINVTATAYNEPSSCDASGCQPGPTHLFVAWEDYRNGNADIYFEWSRDGGDTWLRTKPSSPLPTYETGNIHVRPDPSGQANDPGKSDQRKPHIFLNRSKAKATIEWCQTDYWEENAPPRVYIVWEDDRHMLEGGTTNIFYTRGDYDYRTNTDCNLAGASDLPPYRFEDDHARVNREGLDASQGNPSGAAIQDSFYSHFQFTHTYTDTTDAEVTVQCEARYEINEVIFTWEDRRDGTYDIWAANSWDDINPTPQFALTAPPESTGTVPSEAEARDQCRQGAIEKDLINTNPLVITYEGKENDNEATFMEIAHVESEIKISEGNTFEPKEYCTAPHQSPTDTYPAEPSNQTRPSTVGLPNMTAVTQSKLNEADTFYPTNFWSAWEDTRAYDTGNQDIFLRAALRIDDERGLTVDPFDDPERSTPVRMVQNNVKNQIMLKQWDLYQKYQPVGVVHARPSLSYAYGKLYVGWEDNRNANPLIGFNTNWDIFAAQMQEELSPYNWGIGKPMRKATYLSPVYDAGAVSTWYHIQWWGDISADGEVTLQTRFGLDPDSPEPPLENVAENGWTQWTGVGGTGGVYNAPGQLMAGPDGEQKPRARYVQYRVNFNRGEGQTGIHCLSEVRLNYEGPEEPIDNPTPVSGAGRIIYLPMVMRAPDSTAPSGRVDPNDPYVVHQWNLDRIRAQEAWNITTGAEVNVAVIDSGVDYTHPDLAPRMAPRDLWYNFVADNNDPMDDNSHGTHVAGILAAAANNQEGIAGVSWGARIVPLKVLDGSGMGTSADLAGAIKHAVDRGVRILNISLGGPYPSDVVASEIRNAHSRGAIIIAAAGNCKQGGAECQNLVNPVTYPAALEETIAVGATTYTDGAAPYSNTGHYIDLVAPGGSGPVAEEMILSTVPPTLFQGQGYLFMAGTSMSAPHVAALAALMIGEDPALTNTEVQQILQTTVQDLGPAGRDDTFGHGRIDARTTMEHVWTRTNPAEATAQRVPDYSKLQTETPYAPSIGCRAEHVPDHLLLKKSEQAEVASQSVLASVATELVYDLSEWQVLRVPEGQACSLMEQLNRASGQEVAELDYIYRLPSPEIRQK